MKRSASILVMAAGLDGVQVIGSILELARWPRKPSNFECQRNSQQNLFNLSVLGCWSSKDQLGASLALLRPCGRLCLYFRIYETVQGSIDRLDSLATKLESSEMTHPAASRTRTPCKLRNPLAGVGRQVTVKRDISLLSLFLWRLGDSPGEDSPREAARQGRDMGASSGECPDLGNGRGQAGTEPSFKESRFLTLLEEFYYVLLF